MATTLIGSLAGYFVKWCLDGRELRRKLVQEKYENYFSLFYNIVDNFNKVQMEYANSKNVPDMMVHHSKMRNKIDEKKRHLICSLYMLEMYDMCDSVNKLTAKLVAMMNKYTTFFSKRDEIPVEGRGDLLGFYKDAELINAELRQSTSWKELNRQYCFMVTSSVWYIIRQVIARRRKK